MEKKQCAGQFFYAGELLEYTGPLAPEGFMLPKGMEIIPWEHPMLFWLTFKGKVIAGPARREVLESFVHDLCTNPGKPKGLAEILGEADESVNRSRNRGGRA